MDRGRLLIDTMVELADTQVADYDMVGALYLLCERAVRVAGVEAAGVVLVDGAGELQVAAASSAEMHDLEVFQVSQRQGPCVAALRTAEVVDAPDLAATEHCWPLFAERALAMGFHSAHARPLRLRERPIGALDVLRTAGGDLSEPDAAAVAGLVSIASIGIAHQRALGEAERQVSQLQRALSRRAVVEQATAVLADRLHVDQGTAFDRLRRYARNHNHRLRDVAQRFMKGELDAEALTAP